MANEDLSHIKIAVIGLGYVGLPLALEFSSKYPVIGFDIDKVRIQNLLSGKDCTNESDAKQLGESNAVFSSNTDDIQDCNFYIVTVPTPIDEHNKPNLNPLLSASKTVGQILKRKDIVVYESTVYPGATEEICIPVLEERSSLTFNEDFFVGYSPERINPGDKEHRLKDIVKVTSGSNKTSANLIDSIYGSIIDAGTHLASSIKVAEAAKVIENTQRDLNIALINELAIIFSKLNINTDEVLAAAGTKWNFLPFRPGLVGGHCIGVDPYYLTYKSQSLGYEPEVILAGRRLNDSMSTFIADQIIERLTDCGTPLSEAKILLMGLTFKENCPDLRNTKVIDLFSSLQSRVNLVDVFDPWVESENAQSEYGIDIISAPKKDFYDFIVIAVGHEIFLEMGMLKIKQFAKEKHSIYDLKSIFPNEKLEMRL